MGANERRAARKQFRPEELPELEIVCPACDGTGGYARGCNDCNGSGFVHTDFGKRVLEFLDHNRTRVLLGDRL
jgi:hypothetical protein